MKSLTVFLVIGMLLLATGIPYSILLINGNSAQDGLMGIYLLFAIPSVLLVLLLDRFFTRKFGCNKVNQVHLYFFGMIVLLWVIRFIADLF